MAKEELVKFLKENLKVEISGSTNYGDYDSIDTSLTVSLFLGNEKISTYTDTF